MIKSKFGSVKKMSKYIQPISHYPPPWDVHWTGGLDGTVGQAWSVRVGCPMDVPWMSIGQVDWTGQWDKPGHAVRVGCPMDVPWMSIGQVDSGTSLVSEGGMSNGYPMDIHWTGGTIPSGQRILMANLDMSEPNKIITVCPSQ